jgi:hypothetical protein
MSIVLWRLHLIITILDFLQKEKKKDLVMGPKGVPDTKTVGRLTFVHNINSTQLNWNERQGDG